MKTTEHTVPLDLALEQLESLREWADSNQWVLERARVEDAVNHFHPKSDAYLSGLWLIWESCKFDPKDAESFVRLAVAQGYDALALMGTVDYRKLALVITAQLAIVEGDGLRGAVHDKSSDTPDIWRRLYWFTRFHRAWQRIAIAYTTPQFASLASKAKNARVWKDRAWRYFIAQRAVRKNLSVRSIAENFVTQNKSTIGAHEVQVFLSQRMGIEPSLKSLKK